MADNIPEVNTNKKPLYKSSLDLLPKDLQHVQDNDLKKMTYKDYPQQPKDTEPQDIPQNLEAIAEAKLPRGGDSDDSNSEKNKITEPS